VWEHAANVVSVYSVSLSGRAHGLLAAGVVMVTRTRTRSKHKRTASEKKSLARYWGYSLILALYFGWFRYGFSPVVMEVLSSLVVFWTFFQAPMPCCAENRDKTRCREDSSGFLGACWREQHKWQNVIMLVKRQSWAQWAKAAFETIDGKAAGLTVLVGLVSALAAVVALLMK
jgi:hypothetical protein